MAGRKRQRQGKKKIWALAAAMLALCGAAAWAVLAPRAAHVSNSEASSAQANSAQAGSVQAACRRRQVSLRRRSRRQTME